jgi:phosphotransferase system HPr-like phosphotransfer protein
MTKMISLQVNVTQKLTVRQIIELFQLTKNYDGTISFTCEDRVVKPARLSKLVSFMLTLNECTQLTIHVTGVDPYSITKKINQCCENKGRQQSTYKMIEV